MEQYYFVVYAWRSGDGRWFFNNTIIRGEKPEKWLLKMNENDNKSGYVY